MTTTLAEIETRILAVLQDPNGTRFSSGLLDAAVRLALDTLDQRLPRLSEIEVTIETGGREQALSGLEDCLYLVGLCIVHSGQTIRELEPESEFTYRFQDGLPWLHFSGRRLPKSGEVLRVTYAASHKLDGLDGKTITTLPAAFESALVNGAAGHACLLQATRLAETYGTHPDETTRLMEISRIRLAEFGQTLSNLKVLQSFGFPPGFALDADDFRAGSRRA